MKLAIIAAAAIALPAAPVIAQDMDMDSDDSDAYELDGSELEDRTARVRTSDGVDEEIEFDDDGMARIRGEDGTIRNARYTVDNDLLCIDEDDDANDRCITYTSQFEDGTTYRATDTRGVTSDITFDMDREDTDQRYLSASYGERG